MTRVIITLLATGSGCVDVGPLPVVRADVRLSESVAHNADRLALAITIANDGPGEVLAAVPCPGFVVRDSADNRVGPYLPCSAVAAEPFLLLVGEERTIEKTWSPGDLWPGTYSVSVTAGAATLDRIRLSLEENPAVLEIVP